MSFSLVPSCYGVWIAVSFPFSQGLRYPYAVEIARGADYYREDGECKRLRHVAGFRNKQPSIQRAVALLEHTRCIRGCLTSNGSSVWDCSNTLRVLRCYLSALQCPNVLSHCRIPYEPLDLAYRLGVVPSVLPCRLIDGYFLKNWHTTGTIPEQLQAAAVEAGCEWCPLWVPVLEEVSQPAELKQIAHPR